MTDQHIIGEPGGFLGRAFEFGLLLIPVMCFWLFVLGLLWKLGVF